MLRKKQILSNIRAYNASEIVQAIKSGELTMYELSKSGQLMPLMKKRIEELLKSELKSETPPNTTMKLIPESKELEGPKDTLILSEQPIIVAPPHTNIPFPPEIHSPIMTQNPDSESSILDNKGMFKRVFSFKGRIRRTEYCISYIMYFIWYVIFMSVTDMVEINPMVALLAILSLVTAYWFLWAQGAKRCHDRGNSGWYQIIPFYFLVMLFGGSEEGVNNYGTNPKE